MLQFAHVPRKFCIERLDFFLSLFSLGNVVAQHVVTNDHALNIPLWHVVDGLPDTGEGLHVVILRQPLQYSVNQRVCNGVALIAQDLAHRTSRDVGPPRREAFTVLLIDINIASLCIHIGNHCRYIADDATQVLFALAQLQAAFTYTLLQLFVLLVDGSLCLPFNRHVAKDEHHTAHAPHGIAHGPGTIGDRAFAAIARNKQLVICNTLSLAGCEHCCHRQRGGCPRLLVDNMEYLARSASAHLGNVPAGEPLCCRIHAGNPPLGVGRDDRVTNGAQCDRKVFLVLGECAPTSLGLAQLTPDKDISHRQHRKQQSANQGAYIHQDLACVPLFGNIVLQLPVLLIHHVTQQLERALARFLQGRAGHVSIRRFGAFRFA